MKISEIHVLSPNGTKLSKILFCGMKLYIFREKEGIEPFFHIGLKYSSKQKKKNVNTHTIIITQYHPP